ncbi:MAG: FumA C-terminus/TtdB family hydratase beta subunit [Candidatus Magnetoovum sp. WYHC-5]|nr:FumA C-terminus/TtdB family hydratase beta subunit [Candidatus Magnetoovum sp. WYHC-5]
MYLQTPLKEEDVRSLHVGDTVLISGYIFTGRDKIHKLIFESGGGLDIPFTLDGGIIYHCGPVIRVIDGGSEKASFELLACGPTTSMRLDMYEWCLIRDYHVRAIIGKGGMGERTKEALKDYGCVYLHTISGAAVYLANKVVAVEDVWKYEEFGAADAMWKMQVMEFPAIVTMDSFGRSLHDDIKLKSIEKAKEILILKKR